MERVASVGETEQLMLTRPRDRCIEEPGGTDSAWQPTIDSGLDEARREEDERVSRWRWFARQSGGQIRIYSELGKGTTMCLYLPRHDQVVEDSDAFVLRTEDRPGGQGEVVLVIDDEPTIRMLIAEVLEEHGYAVVEASDGPSGMRILQSAARIDLLITDVGLPNGMNGRQIADAARQTRPELKVLFITGYAENAVVGNGHLDKGMHVIAKPFAMDMLGKKIGELIQS